MRASQQYPGIFGVEKVSFIELSLVFLIKMEPLCNAYAFSKRWYSHVTSSPVRKLLEIS